MVVCGIPPLHPSTRGLQNVRIALRALLPALLVVFTAGCGSDEPAMKTMSEAEQQKEIEAQRASQEKSMKAQMESQSKNKQYQNTAKSGS